MCQVGTISTGLFHSKSGSCRIRLSRVLMWMPLTAISFGIESGPNENARASVLHSIERADSRSWASVESREPDWTVVATVQLLCLVEQPSGPLIYLPCQRDRQAQIHSRLLVVDHGHRHPLRGRVLCRPSALACAVDDLHGCSCRSLHHRAEIADRANSTLR